MSTQRYAVSYSRFSHRRQSGGSTLKRQEELLDEWLARPENRNVVLLESFSDEGVSGFKGAHASKGAFSRFLELLRGGKLPQNVILVVESIDRLSREKILDAWDRFSELLKLGVEIAVLDMRLDITREALNRESWKLHSLFNAMERAHGESQRKSDLVTAAWNLRIRAANTDKRAVRGYVGPPWCSIDKVTQRYVVNEDQAETVRDIFRWRASGMSAHAIAKRLNEESRPVFRAHMAKDRKRNGWHQPYVTTILKNRQVLGEHRFKVGEVIEGYFDPVIDPALFHQVQQMADPVDRRPGRRGETLTNLFTGLLRCDWCGGTMQISVNRKAGPDQTKYLSCSAQKRRFACDSGTRFLNYKVLEDTILTHLDDLPWSEIVQLESPNNPIPALDAAVAETEVELARITKERDRAKSLLLKDAEFEAEFEPIYRESTKQMREVAHRLDELKAERHAAGKAWGNRASYVADAIESRQRMATAKGAELYAIRSRLAATLRGIINVIGCSTPDKKVQVIVGQSHENRYGFMIEMPARRQPKVRRMNMDRTITDLTPDVVWKDHSRPSRPRKPIFKAAAE